MRNYYRNSQIPFPKGVTEDGEKGLCRREAENEKIGQKERRGEGGAALRVVSSCERGCVVCGGVQGAR